MESSVSNTWSSNSIGQDQHNETEIIHFKTDNPTLICDSFETKNKRIGYRIRRNFKVTMNIVCQDVNEGDYLMIQMVHSSAIFSHRQIFACNQHNDSGSHKYPFHIYLDGEDKPKTIHYNPNVYTCTFDVPRMKALTFKAVCNNSCHKMSLDKNCHEGKFIDLLVQILDPQNGVKYVQRIPLNVREQLRPMTGTRGKRRMNKKRPKIKLEHSTCSEEEPTQSLLLKELHDEFSKYTSKLDERGENERMKHWLEIFKELNIAQK